MVCSALENIDSLRSLRWARRGPSTSTPDQHHGQPVLKVLQLLQLTDTSQIKAYSEDPQPALASNQRLHHHQPAATPVSPRVRSWFRPRLYSRSLPTLPCCPFSPPLCSPSPPPVLLKDCVSLSRPSPPLSQSLVLSPSLLLPRQGEQRGRPYDSLYQMF